MLGFQLSLNKLHDLAAILAAGAEGSKVYHSINPTINSDYMAYSLQMEPQNAFDLLMANLII